MAYTERSQALYTQLANALREQITSGALPPGAPLPSEAEMRTAYGVSRPTARAAINALRAEGIVTVIHGKGSFVRHATPLTRRTHHRSVTRTPTPTGRTRRRASGDAAASPSRWAYTDTDTAGWAVVGEPECSRTTATPTLALALVIPEHTPLFVSHRLLQQDGNRMTHRLYLPLPMCAEVPALETDPFRAPGDLYTVLATHYGELRFTEHVRAAMPTPEDIDTLHLPDATPLLFTQRTTHSPAGRPLALEETRLSAEGAQLSYTLTATTADTSA
ncbi:MAG: GntR family transcriptional regulator [Pseudonocardiaceae bacterium]